MNEGTSAGTVVMMIIGFMGIFGGFSAFLIGAFKDKHRYQAQVRYLIDLCVEFGIFDRRPTERELENAMSGVIEGEWRLIDEL